MLNKLKDIGTSALTDAFDKFTSTKISDTYDAGLPDVKGPKLVTLTFFKDRVEITYKDYFIISKKIVIKPNDILELAFGVQDTSTTANTISGAIVGGLLMGGLGALAVAGHHAKRRKEDSLHIVINYKGQSRPLHFQSSKKSQKLYKEFSKLFGLRTLSNPTLNSNQIVVTNDIAKQLTDLHNLMQQGVLTQEEFEIQKRKILSS